MLIFSQHLKVFVHFNQCPLSSQYVYSHVLISPLTNRCATDE